MNPLALKFATFSLFALVYAVATADAQSAAAANDRARHPNGIWKAAVPPTPMHGEFENFDPLGVAAGAWIKADCSLNWVDPDDGKRYCFASGTSLEVFLEEPQTNLERARLVWRKVAASHRAAPVH